MQNTKQNIEQIIKNAEKNLQNEFENLEEICLYNQKKVLDAFRDNRIAEEHFFTVSGYGHDDMGREAIDKTFAQIFKAEKAIVRPHFVSGTHALACALFGNLRYGEKLVSIAGRPYDTMEEVIGLRGNKRASLAGHGVQYDEVPLVDGLHIDYEGIEKTVDKNTNMVLIQRSRGYSLRDPITMEMMERIIKIVKSKNPDCICFVDNCYGEFTQMQEPIELGADLIAGSLIKNPGGGIVEAGGYILGKEEYVEQASIRLTAPGIAGDGGAMLNQSRLILQGLFMSPSIVKDAIKGALLAAKVFEELGFKTSPKYTETRSDIIQTIEFGSAEPLEKFCRALQASSPVDSYVTPIPDDVPGYDDKLIMAGGSFIEGSTIELSADGPLRAPYVAYMQGGLNYAHVKIAIMNVLNEILG
jgi:cystathionine beta-lyase family protein involved in aluminum resistance